MADRKVRYILEVDYEGEGVTARAAEDLREVDAAAKASAEGLDQASSGFSKVQANIVTMQSALGIAEQAFAGIQQAAEFAYQTLSEGAALADARADFEDLARGIGSTADVLENELSAAAAGLMTDAELIGQAGELMALGLDLTKDELVQLTGLAAELDWNMETLANTLNTQSTRGLKELGLSIADVKGKMAELEAQGMATDDAFKWAIIEAGGERLERVGRKSEETAGQIQQLEVMVQNVQDEFARGSAEGFAETLGIIAGSAPAAGAALEAAARGAAYFLTQFAGLASLNLFGGSLDFLIDKGMELEAQERAQAEARAETARAYQWLIDQYAAGAEAQEDAADATAAVVAQGEMAQVATQEYAVAQEWLARATDWVAEAQERSRAADYGRSQEMLEQAQALALINEAQAEWIAYTTEMTAAGGDAFTGFINADKAWDFAAGVYAAADAAGAGAGPLAELAESLGLIDDASGALDSVANQAIAQSLAQAAQEGRIAWDEYADAVQRAIDVYNGAPLVDLGPREIPEPDMRGYRENFQEALEMMPNELEPVSLEVQLEQESIQAAVDTARGVVEGFAETPFEAAVTMNIDDVIEKGGEVQQIIDGLPEQKSITIDFTATGLEFLQELREAGVIP